MDGAASIESTSRRLAALLPGVALAAAIAVVAMVVRQIPGVALLSPLIIAVLVGGIVRNTRGIPASAQPGITFSARRLLRTAIVLLGLQLSFTQVEEVGLRGLAILILIVVATLAFSRWLGRRLGVGAQLTDLIAAGTSICGASAVLAMNSVTRAQDEDVAYAVASVTVFGTIAMFAYPALFHVLGLTDSVYGFWAGASIHEVAQVVAAAFQVDARAGELGTVVKLTRVMMLAPLVLSLSVLAIGGEPSARGRRGMPAVPWFVVGFGCAVVINSTITIPADLRTLLATVATFLLSMALAALGLEIAVAKLRAQGLRPLLLGLVSSLFIAGLSFALTKFVL